jgi:predicted transcriptional regulator
MVPEPPADDHDEDRTDKTPDDGLGIDIETGDGAEGDTDIGARERLEQGADKAVSGFDEGLVDLLAWLLDTETRARIYVYLRQQPGSTSEEVADGTGLYPSTVREALADLADEGTVTRRKREHDGAGNNPYEYTAIAPSDLVRNAAKQVQSELNTVFNLDNQLGGDGAASHDEAGPVTITVNEEWTAADTSGGGEQSGVSDDAGASDDAGDDASP